MSTRAPGTNSGQLLLTASFRAVSFGMFLLCRCLSMGLTMTKRPPVIRCLKSPAFWCWCAKRFDQVVRTLSGVVEWTPWPSVPKEQLACRCQRYVPNVTLDTASPIKMCDCGTSQRGSTWSVLICIRGWGGEVRTTMHGDVNGDMKELLRDYIRHCCSDLDVAVEQTRVVQNL